MVLAASLLVRSSANAKQPLKPKAKAFYLQSSSLQDRLQGDIRVASKLVVDHFLWVTKYHDIELWGSREVSPTATDASILARKYRQVCSTHKDGNKAESAVVADWPGLGWD